VILLGLGGKVPETHLGRVASRTKELPATGPKELGSRRVKIRYGPYEVPGKDRGAIGKMMDGEGGMAWNMPERNVQKPCTHCMVTYIEAGLEDPAGNVKNTKDGLWLHHMVALK
jgi:hypothetical protein